MIFTEHFADDTGGFLGLAAEAQAQSVHSEKDAALHRLEAVAHIREGSGHDDRHRIIDVGRTHFMVNFYRLYIAVDDFFTIHKNPMVIIVQR